ncbi:serine hydrolase domain-containing protein [Paenibacillus glacialis]|uniref:Penicillin-binding protein n=1 Tax=Paenibacillus glacialis TaxID=494026 RepID=A0A168HM35_9BACL|nr:serine hydrolase domain-containing protein [Paenibacillus glacialis]OAB38322.1 penicillin-binding protein [Paenibacillus glacialis]
MIISKELEKLLDVETAISKFSGSILIKRDGNDLFKSSYDYADRRELIKNTMDTRFTVASGSKIFTAVAICQLVERGFITFDTLIKECIDISFPIFSSDITIHHLLTHTSGIPDYFDEEFMTDYEKLWENYPMYRVFTSKDFLPLFQEKEMKFQPGERFSYCNAGFILLGLIVEQISGMNFITYIQRNILDVCNMKNSGYFRMDQLPNRTAIGYIEDQKSKEWRTNIYSVPIIGGADGGAYTTTYDLNNFWSGLMGHKLLKEETTIRMLSPQVEIDDFQNYGYGVWMTIIGDEIFKYYVMGGEPGAMMVSSVYVKSSIRAHVMSNKSNGTAEIPSKIDELIYNSE